MATDHTRTLIEHWDGVSWSIVKSPNSVVGGYLMSVACTSTIDCFAVGWDNWDPGATLIEHWNGSTWSIVPSPTRGHDGSLSSVACTSATSCMAVGEYDEPGSSHSLAERWNGLAWSVLIPAEPDWRTASGIERPAINSELTGIACLGVTTCTAVGFWNGGTRASPLIEHWNGTQWSIEQKPYCAEQSPQQPRRHRLCERHQLHGGGIRHPDCQQQSTPGGAMERRQLVDSKYP